MTKPSFKVGQDEFTKNSNIGTRSGYTTFFDCTYLYVTTDILIIDYNFKQFKNDLLFLI